MEEKRKMKRNDEIRQHWLITGSYLYAIQYIYMCCMYHIIIDRNLNKFECIKGVNNEQYLTFRK